jgi:D-3-phosphoglycerate dehydrogenase
VANVPDYGADIEVSDHAAALTLALMRRVVTRDAQVKGGQWNIAQAEPIYRIAGSTLGLVGFGKIARAYLEKMRAFGIGEVLVYDPYIPEAFAAQFGARRVEFDELCRHAQIISLHAPATAETRNIVNRRTLGLMSARTCLINTSRGGLIDTSALAEALSSGKIFGAALDVLDSEPMAAECPLRDLKNVILTDHTGWYSESSVRTLQEKAAQAACEILTTGIPTNWVNKR